jgi:hypothetical protein
MLVDIMPPFFKEGPQPKCQLKKCAKSAEKMSVVLTFFICKQVLGIGNKQPVF